MTTPDRPAATVAQGHEDAVQAWPQEDGAQVCGNCDGRKCMDCVFRTVHDYCTDDCPSCCTPAPVSSPAGEDVERVVALVDDAIVRVPKLGGAGAIYEAELLSVLREARAALSARPVQAQGTDDGEVERLRERMPCDGGCDWNSGPEETCSLHGRAPRDIWDVVNRIGAERDAALARAEAAEVEVGTLRRDYSDLMAEVRRLRAALSGQPVAQEGEA